MSRRMDISLVILLVLLITAKSLVGPIRMLIYEASLVGPLAIVYRLSSFLRSWNAGTLDLYFRNEELS